LRLRRSAGLASTNWITLTTRTSNWPLGVRSRTTSFFPTRGGRSVTTVKPPADSSISWAGNQRAPTFSSARFFAAGTGIRNDLRFSMGGSCKDISRILQQKREQ